MHPDTPADTAPTLSALRALFDIVVDLDATERERWLEANVPDAGTRDALRELVAADAGAGALDVPADELGARMGDADVLGEGMVGRDIAGFRLVRLLGQGGMASVFLGERTGRDFTQRAAIKLLRRGLYSALEQRLFQRERRVLAALDHPNIARLIDGGVTDAGMPYLVLEFVDGEPITHYAQRHGLDLRARLRLIVDVCAAVEAAHRMLVVHRDIKPANILVTTPGEVKLLDFGIAKLIEEEPDATAAGVFTRHYAAPEQLRGGAVTTATDVYGLGVLLRELLLGFSPDLDADSERVPLPSALATHDDATTGGAALRRLLRGDLDNIVMKALDREPVRRYASAGALADDIGRYLDGRPVHAHPPTRWYRVRKFVQRHRVGVASGAVLFIALVAALVIDLHATDVALREARRAGAMRDFMVTAFEQAEPGGPRAGAPRITEITEQAIARARSDATMDASVRTELLTHLVAVMRQQGRVDDALEAAQWNFDHASADAHIDPALVVSAGGELLSALMLLDRFAEGRRLADDLLERARMLDPATRSLTLQLAAQLASKQHDLARCVALATEALALARSTGDDDLIAQTLGQYGNALKEKGDNLGAIAAWEEQLRLRVAKHGPQHAVVATIHAALSRPYQRIGDLKTAQAHIEAAVAIDAAVLPQDHWRRALHLNALALLRYRQRDFAAALVAAREGLRIDRINFGDDHPDTENDLNSIGMFEFMLEDYTAAVPPLAEALRIAEAKFGPEAHDTATQRANHGLALAYAGDAAGGAAELQHAIASLDANPDASAEDRADAREKLVRLSLDGLRHDNIDAALDRIDALTQGSHDPYWIGRAAMLRAQASLQRNDTAAALAALDAATRALGAAEHPDVVLMAICPLLRAQAEQKTGQLDTARADAALAAQRLAVLPNPPSRWMRALGEVQQTLGMPATH